MVPIGAGREGKEKLRNDRQTHRPKKNEQTKRRMENGARLEKKLMRKRTKGKPLPKTP